jgi:hypothetical protein
MDVFEFWKTGADMHEVTFILLGNADCCRIYLHNGKKILFDYAQLKDPDDEGDQPRARPL